MILHQTRRKSILKSITVSLTLLCFLLPSIGQGAPPKANKSATSKPTQRKRNAEPYFPLKVGNTWKYRSTGGFAKKARFYSVTITAKKGNVYLGKRRRRRYQWTSHGLTTGRQYLLKYPIRVGETWDVDWSPKGQMARLLSRGKIKIMAVNAKVHVSGKVYSPCIVTKNSSGFSGTWAYYCKGVGLVKEESKGKRGIFWKRELVSHQLK